MYVGIIDNATLFHVCKRIAQRAAPQVWHAIQLMWLVPFGLPLLLSTDDDGAFMGPVCDKLSTLGVEVRLCAPEAHWQLGRIERHNYTFKQMMQKVVDSNSACTNEDIDLACLSVCHAKNLLIQRQGRCTVSMRVR
eukprot:2639584-Amphidinium_carterae.3